MVTSNNPRNHIMTTIVSTINKMGLNPIITANEIDSFVDECIAFLNQVQSTSSGLDLRDDIFTLEEARQLAVSRK